MCTLVSGAFCVGETEDGQRDGVPADLQDQDALQRDGADAGRHPAVNRHLHARRAGSVSGDPHPHSLQQQPGARRSGRRVLRLAGLRGAAPGRPGAGRLRGSVDALRPRGRGWLRRPGVGGEAVLVHRQGGHQRCIVRGPDPVAAGAAPESLPHRHGAPRGLLQPLPQLGLHRGRLPARLQPSLGRHPDAHADEPDAVSLAAGRGAPVAALLAPAVDRRRPASSTRSGSAIRATMPIGSAWGTSRQSMPRSTSRPTGSAAGTMSSSSPR